MDRLKFIDSISVVRPAYVYRNAESICRYTGISNSSDLRLNFLESINQLQKHQFKFEEERPSIYLNFGYGSDLNKEVIREIMEVELDQGWQYSLEEINDIKNKTYEALRMIEMIHPHLYAAINTIVGTFLYARRTGFGGGSVSSAIGAIWLSPLSSWTIINYAERIVHEYVHLCLFLDQMVNTLFTRDVPVMAMEDGLATSAILKRKRGFDKSFHSAFVATVLAQFYTELEMYSDANALLSSSTLITFEELKSKRQFLTIHGKKVLDEIYNIFLKLRLDNKGVMARC